MPFGAVAAGIGAAASVAGTVQKLTSGSSTGGSTQTQTTDASHTPWAPQGTAITNALTDATSLYNQRQASGAYTGPTYAGLNGTQNSAIQGAMTNATGAGAQAVSTDAATGQLGQSYLQPAEQAASTIAANGLGTTPNTTQTGALQAIGGGSDPVVNQQLAGALNSAATNGASTIGSFSSGLANNANAASTDSTGQITQDATQIANSSGVNANIAANNAITDQTLNETTVPQLNRAAAMGGQLNSSRAGMAEAQANEAAALVKSQNAASLQSSAFNSGLTTAASQHTAGLNSAIAANTAGLTGNANLALGTANNDVAATNTQVAADVGGLNAATSNASANAQAQLAGNAQLIEGTNTGLNATNQSQSLNASNLTQLDAAGTQQQVDAQGQLTQAQKAQTAVGDYDQGILSNYMASATAPQGYYNASTATTGSNNTTGPNQTGQAIATLGAGAAAGLAPGGTAAPGGALYNAVTGTDSSNPWGANTAGVDANNYAFSS